MKHYFGVICMRNKQIAEICTSRKEAESYAYEMQDPDCNQENFSIEHGLKNISLATGLSVKQIKERQ